MKRTMMAVVVALMMMPVGVSAQKHPLWKCDIKAFYQLGDDGLFGETERSIDYRKSNPTIFFDEATGLFRWSAEQVTFEVDQHGDSENGIVAVGRHPSKVFERLYIKTWADGSKKPFVYNFQTETVTGLCVRQ